MIEILAMSTIIAPITAALVQAIKVSTRTRINKNFFPLISIIVGIGLGAAATFLGTDLIIRMWAGGISGLAATGLFEISKRGKDFEE